ncbi:extracellular calcium-sensing receptor-like [Gadus chalcogrammus]|uniref:extracellular calcium-sensing receptor-like n=1 Tax=Gadus chalcogrammus TaxID=1042646 RepID=UPI0024C4A5E8|nr:extracellular calcium-sensing receptor-like [Gadus chalcogrammus]
MFLLNDLIVSSAALFTECASIGEEESNSFYEDGDVVLGGIFPLHYTRVSSLPTYTSKPEPGSHNFSARALRWMQTMTFAIREINQRSDLLPALRLGFHIRDSCNDVPVSLKASLLLVNGQPGPPAIRNVSLEAVGEHSGKGDLISSGFRSPVLGCADVTRSPSPVIIGDASSGVSMALLRSLGPFQIPLVSYFASCSCLSEQTEFPMFMRTMPSDAFQVRALARLVSHFGWTWVGVIGLESDYARFAIQLFLHESSLYGVCAAYVHLYPVVLSQQPLDELLDIIQGSSSKVIINFNSESEVQSIMRAIRQRNITGIQWIASEAWATAKSLWEEFGDLLSGTLGFGIRRAEVIPGLKQHLSRLRPSNIQDSSFLTELWEETLNCRLNGSVNTHSHMVNHLDRKPCSGMEDLNDVYSAFSDVSQLRVSYNVYKAVYLVAHALQKMSDCEAGQGPFVNGSCGKPQSLEPWQLFHYMKNTKFSILGEKVDFDRNGDPIASYDLMNWRREQDGSLRLLKVGFYDTSLSPELSLVVNDSAIQWPVRQQAVRSVCSESCPPGKRVARRKGKPVCCFDCVTCAEGEVSNNTDSLDCTRCPEDMWPNDMRNLCLPKNVEFLSYKEPMGIVLCTGSVLGTSSSLLVLAMFYKHRATPVVRANNMELSFFLLLFLATCFLIGLLFIGEPSDWLCRIRYPAFGISFALCISCLLAKTVVVLMAFRATLPGSGVMKLFGPNQQRASVLLCTLVQGLICIIWLLTYPPFTNCNTGYLRNTIIIECATGSEVGFWCVLGYIGLLACLCFFMAFLARELPDNFNEAKFITFSMLIFFAVWITFIPVYVSTAGKYTVAVHIFAILASAYGLLFCIFAPKCYIIIFKPEKNSKKNMMRK